MALIQCYECNKEISDKAFSCPKCGAPKIKKITCYECNKEINEKALSCPKCGAPKITQKTQQSLDKKNIDDSKDYELEKHPIKKDTWLTRLLKKQFPDNPKIQYRLNLLFIPILHVFVGIIIPSLKIDALVSSLIGGLFFLMLLPVSLYYFLLFIFSFLFNYRETESFSSKYGTNILGFGYILMISYLIYTLNDEMAGGWLIQLWFDIVDY